MFLVSLFSTLFSLILLFLFSNRVGYIVSSYLTILSMLISFIVPLFILFNNFFSISSQVTLFNFFSINDFSVSYTFYSDNLSLSMLCLVSFISCCVQFYTISYLDNTELVRFYMYMLSFTFFMNLLVTSWFCICILIGVGGCRFIIISVN